MIIDNRKGPRARPAPKLGSRPFNFDRHGDVIDLDDACGATVADLDPLAMRWLARSPVERSAR